MIITPGGGGGDTSGDTSEYVHRQLVHQVQPTTPVNNWVKTVDPDLIPLSPEDIETQIRLNQSRLNDPFNKRK